MKSRITQAPTAALLAMVLFGHCVILLVLEPAMGFRRIADFFALPKVVPALESATWFASNCLHVAMGAVLVQFRFELVNARGDQRCMAGDFLLAAAPLFVVVGMSGFAGKFLLDVFTSNPAGLEASLYGLLAVRLFILAGAVALFGMAIAAVSLRADIARPWVRALGVPVALAAILFVIVPTPVPLLLFAWVVAFVFGRLPG